MKKPKKSPFSLFCIKHLGSIIAISIATVFGTLACYEIYLAHQVKLQNQCDLPALSPQEEEKPQEENLPSEMSETLAEITNLLACYQKAERYEVLYGKEFASLFQKCCNKLVINVIFDPGCRVLTYFSNKQSWDQFQLSDSEIVLLEESYQKIGQEAEFEKIIAELGKNKGLQVIIYENPDKIPLRTVEFPGEGKLPIIRDVSAILPGLKI